LNYLKKCISFYLIYTLNDIKKILEEQIKIDEEKYGNNLKMDIVNNNKFSIQNNKNNENYEAKCKVNFIKYY